VNNLDRWIFRDFFADYFVLVYSINTGFMIFMFKDSLYSACQFMVRFRNLN